MQVSVQHLIDPQRFGLSWEAAVKLTGDNREQVKKLLEMIVEIVRQNEQKFSEIAIAINCVGGKARSVALAELAAVILEAIGYEVSVTHLDIDKPPLEKIGCVEE